MFQQQLVVSEQQMPHHPTAINPPIGRQQTPTSQWPQAARTHGRGEGGD